MAVALSASVIFGLLGLNKRKIARQIRSRALWFDAFNTLKSSAASFSAFLGILLSYFGFFQADPMAGIAIGSIIFIVAYITIKEASLTLLDACTCVDVIETIKKAIRGVEGVKEVEDVKLRSTGPFILGEVTVKVDGEMTVYEFSRITREIRELGENQIDNLIGLTVQAKPVGKRKENN
jgi:cation diffusion facilitator family transporter